MAISIIYLFSLLCHALFGLLHSNADINDPGKVNDNIKLTILYDNYVYVKGTEAEWGFSCFIENTEKTILFDTGTDPDILIKNANVLKKDLGKIDLIVISHNHLDHTGGLFEVLSYTVKVKVYLPYSTHQQYIDAVKSTGAEVVNKEESLTICENCILTGELGNNIKEQSLILETKDGLIVITGCSHPGIVNIVKRVKELSEKDIYMVLGGFHLMNHSDEKVKNIIAEFKEMGVKICGPSHCTGDRAIKLFKEAYGKNYVKMGTGFEMNFRK